MSFHDVLCARSAPSVVCISEEKANKNKNEKTNEHLPKEGRIVIYIACFTGTGAERFQSCFEARVCRAQKDDATSANILFIYTIPNV